MKISVIIVFIRETLEEILINVTTVFIKERGSRYVCRYKNIKEILFKQFR